MFKIHETKGVTFRLDICVMPLLASPGKTPQPSLGKVYGELEDMKSCINETIKNGTEINTVMTYTVGFATCGKPML